MMQFHVDSEQATSAPWNYFIFLLGRLRCLLHRHRLYIPVIRTGSSTQTFLDGYLTSSILCIPCQIWCVTIEVLHNLPPTLQLCSEGALLWLQHPVWYRVDIFFVLASLARASSWLLAPWAVFCTPFENIWDASVPLRKRSPFAQAQSAL